MMLMSDTRNRRRIQLTVAMLALIALGFYAGFIFMVAGK